MFHSLPGRIVLIVVLAVLVGSVQTGCDSTPTSPDNLDSKTFTSSNDQGHTHAITIQKAEVETASGISRQTSANGHTHTFTMTSAELTNVKNGAAVLIKTADSNGHTHNFTIQKWY